MPIHRPRNWIAYVGLATVTAYPACATKTVGVEECRQVEDARCEAAPNCPDQFDVTDVEQCKLFYRDHCMHGLPVDTPPTGSVLKHCVDAIHDLSKCAATQDGSAALLVNCLGVETTNPKITKVCKLLAAPESISVCNSFLAADSSSGGEASTTGGTTATATGGTTSSSSAGGSSGFGGLTL